MVGQASSPDEENQAVLPQDVVSKRRTRSLWTGLGIAALMVIGVSVCQRPPLDLDESGVIDNKNWFVDDSERIWFLDEAERFNAEHDTQLNSAFSFIPLQARGPRNPNERQGMRGISPAAAPVVSGGRKGRQQDGGSRRSDPQMQLMLRGYGGGYGGGMGRWSDPIVPYGGYGYGGGYGGYGGYGYGNYGSYGYGRYGSYGMGGYGRGYYGAGYDRYGRDMYYGGGGYGPWGRYGGYGGRTGWGVYGDHYLPDPYDPRFNMGLGGTTHPDYYPRRGGSRRQQVGPRQQGGPQAQRSGITGLTVPNERYPEQNGQYPQQYDPRYQQGMGGMPPGMQGMGPMQGMDPMQGMPREGKATKEQLEAEKERLEKELAAKMEALKPQPTPLELTSRTEVDVHKVLQAWSDAIPTEVKARHSEDSQKPTADKMSIQRMQQDLGMHMMDHHVLGLAHGKASEDNIQAIASVGLQTEWSGNGALQELAKEQGLEISASGDDPRDAQVPVVLIDSLVTTPKEKLHHTYLVEGDAVQSIIDWAKQMNRLVKVSPASDQEAEFYQSLGFDFIDNQNRGYDAPVMVYRGNKKDDEATASTTRSERGLELIDFDLSETEQERQQRQQQQQAQQQGQQQAQQQQQQQPPYDPRQQPPYDPRYGRSGPQGGPQYGRGGMDQRYPQQYGPQGGQDPRQRRRPGEGSRGAFIDSPYGGRNPEWDGQDPRMRRRPGGGGGSMGQRYPQQYGPQDGRRPEPSPYGGRDGWPYGGMDPQEGRRPRRRPRGPEVSETHRAGGEYAPGVSPFQYSSANNYQPPYQPAKDAKERMRSRSNAQPPEAQQPKKTQKRSSS